jgi:hypothetical protein
VEGENVTAARHLHPNTLAAHLKRKGFRNAIRDRAGFCLGAGFALAKHPEGVTMRHIEPAAHGPVDNRAELMKMVDALGPDFEVAADLRNRVVVRRAVKP